MDWGYFDKFSSLDEKYLPARGEGETMATQIDTAITKLVYKWYNDGDVFDNTGFLSGWCNNLSSYANWLYKYVPQSQGILEKIWDIHSQDEYEQLLADLCDMFVTEEFLGAMDKLPKEGSVYSCEGPFVFAEYDDDDEDY